MLTVAISVPYWGHTAAVCLLVDGITRLWLPTCPQNPPQPPPAHPPLYTLSMILQRLEKTTYLKTQQC